MGLNGHFWPKMVLFCTYGWFVPFSGWFSVQFYLGQFKLSRFLCGDFDFAIIAKNWHFFRVTLWYFFFLQNRCFSHTAPNKSEMSETTWKWIQWKMASADWLIGKCSDVRMIRIGWEEMVPFFFFFSSNNDETLKREKLFELEVFLKVYLFYYQGYLLKLSEDKKIT